MNTRSTTIALTAIAAALGATASSGSAGTVDVYNDFYGNFNSASSLQFGTDTATWAYAANGADGFGSIVGFDNPANQPLSSASVIMSNWNGWDPNGGPGTATASYQHDFTIELYDVDRTGSAPDAGSLIASVTETQTVAGRQLPGDTPVSGSGTDFVMDWDLSGLNITTSELLFMVSFDRVDDSATAFDELEALNSLNIAAADIDKSLDVTTGTDTDDSIFWRSTSTNGDIASFNGAGFGSGIQGGGQVFSRFGVVPAPGAMSLLALGGLVGARRRR